MYKSKLKRLSKMVSVGIAMFGLSLLNGCSKDAELSKTEMKKLSDGPSAEDREKAKQAFEQAAKAPINTGPPAGTPGGPPASGASNTGQ